MTRMSNEEIMKSDERHEKIVRRSERSRRYLKTKGILFIAGIGAIVLYIVLARIAMLFGIDIVH